MRISSSALETLAVALSGTFSGIDAILDRVIENPTTAAERGISDAVRGYPMRSSDPVYIEAYRKAKEI